MRRSLFAVSFAVSIASESALATERRHEDRMSRHKSMYSWRYGISDNMPQWRQWMSYCQENPNDPTCRHESDPIEKEILWRGINASMPIHPTDVTRMPVAPAASQDSPSYMLMPSRSPSSPSEGPSRGASSSPSKIATNSGIPSQMPSQPKNLSPSVMPSAPSHLPSQGIAVEPTLGPTLIASSSPSSTSSPPSQGGTLEPSIGQTSLIPSSPPSTSSPNVIITSFPSSLSPTASPSSFPNGPTQMPSQGIAPPKMNYTSFPSQSPSESGVIVPSIGPTSKPSSMAPPEVNYTLFPSQSPTLPLNATREPTSMPALSPISSPGLCTLDQNGDTGVTTNMDVVVVYYYEIEYDPSIFDPTQRDMIFLVETTTAKGLLKGLFESECATAQGRQIQVYAIRQRWLQNQFGVVGFSSQPNDTVVPETCSGGLNSSTNVCALIEGGITLYLKNGYNNTDDLESTALGAIEAYLNSGDLEDSVQGVVNVVYINGSAIAPTESPTNSPSTAMNPTQIPGEKPTSTPIPGTVQPTEQPTASKLPIYAYVILIGISPLLLFSAFLYLQRKRKRDANINEAGGSQGRSRLHLMSIPTRDSEHSTSVPMESGSVSRSLSRSDSGSFQSLKERRIPHGDEELTLRPTASLT